MRSMTYGTTELERMSNEALIHLSVISAAASGVLIGVLTGRFLRKTETPHLLMRDLPIALKFGVTQYAVGAFVAGPITTWGQQSESGFLAEESSLMLPLHVFAWLAILAWIDLIPLVARRFLSVCLPVIGCTSVLLTAWCLYWHDWWTVLSIGYYGFLALFGVTIWQILSPLLGVSGQWSVSE